MRFSEKVAIVTGAGSGIGRAIAISLAKEGAKVVVADINETACKSITGEIRTQGGEALDVKVDVTSSAEIRNAMQKTLERLGRVDILVNSAGGNKVHRFLEGSEEYWDRIIALNLKSVILFSRAALEDMVKRKYGKIINIASDAGRTGSTGQVVYGACKSGIIGFTKCLAAEMAQFRINVNCVSPGLIDTPGFHHGFDDVPRLTDAYLRLIPWRRLGHPEEIAAAVLFLASDDAEYINGQTLSVNSGMVMPG